jgi:hypothetical protein
MSRKIPYPTEFSNESRFFRPERKKYWAYNIDWESLSDWDKLAYPAIREAKLRFEQKQRVLADHSAEEVITLGLDKFDKLNIDLAHFGDFAYPSRFWYSFGDIDTIDKTKFTYPLTVDKIKDQAIRDEDEILQPKDYYPLVRLLTPDVRYRKDKKLFFSTVTEYRSREAIRFLQPRLKKTYTFDFWPDSDSDDSQQPKPPSKKLKRHPEYYARAPGGILKLLSAFGDREEYWKQRDEFQKKYERNIYVQNEILHDTYTELLEKRGDLKAWFNSTTSCVETREQQEYNGNIIEVCTLQTEDEITLEDKAILQEDALNWAQPIAARAWHCHQLRQLGKTYTIRTARLYYSWPY